MNGLRKCSMLMQWNFYLVTKKNEILSFLGKWLELENIILSEGSHSEDQKLHVLPHICNTDKCSNIMKHWSH
jgi:hypothetical protein